MPSPCNIGYGIRPLLKTKINPKIKLKKIDGKKDKVTLPVETHANVRRQESLLNGLRGVEFGSLRK